MIVEPNETLMDKKKHNRGHRVGRFGVFGVVKARKKVFLFITVEKRVKQPLQ